jgi:hypothetical protein
MLPPQTSPKIFLDKDSSASNFERSTGSKKQSERFSERRGDEGVLESAREEKREEESPAVRKNGS